MMRIRMMYWLEVHEGKRWRWKGRYGVWRRKIIFGGVRVRLGMWRVGLDMFENIWVTAYVLDNCVALFII